MERMTAKEYLSMGKRSKSKYKNKSVELDGHTFASRLEARYYAQLKLREKGNDILFFKVHPRYLLQPAFVKDGKKHQKIEYVADFEIHHTDGSIEVVDTKGTITAVFRLKEKLFHNRYPHKLTIVKEGDF